MVTPMANERDTAAAVIEAVLEATASFGEVRHFVVCDRATRDGTREIVESLAEDDERIVPIWAPENRSVVDAYVRGYREALARGYDWVLEIDAGFSHQPAEFERFVPHMGSADCIFGSRFLAGSDMEDTPMSRKAMSRLGTILAMVLLGTRLTDMTGGYELLRADAARRILDRGIRSRAHFWHIEVKFHARDMATVEVPISYCSPSPSVKPWVLWDATKNLARLVWLRLRKTA